MMLKALWRAAGLTIRSGRCSGTSDYLGVIIGIARDREHSFNLQLTALSSLAECLAPRSIAHLLASCRIDSGTDPSI
ncbi:MAG: hypothetical protein ACK6AO_12545 [Planctomycetota bacterium]